MSKLKKLIEVSMPLAAINAASTREKSIRHGHPSTLHLWWARRPLATCRAVLFAQLVDDPGEYLPAEEAKIERKRLHKLISRLVVWENSKNEEVLNEVKLEIARSVERNGGPTLVQNPTPKKIKTYLAENCPPILDPFCGGGSIPLEALRLGLNAHGSDLNPVAVMINKALVEIPSKFAGNPPVNPDVQQRLDGKWIEATGLAKDIQYYGQMMRDKAMERIGHHYPKATLANGCETDVIAWLWARTVTCPNPSCKTSMPLINSFQLSNKKGRKAWLNPIIDYSKKSVEFEIKIGDGEIPPSPKVGRGPKFKCLVCNEVPIGQYIKDEGMAKRMGSKLIAIVAQGNKKRVYLAPTKEHLEASETNKPSWSPDFKLNYDRRAIWCPAYGLQTYTDLFTTRQLFALNTFSDLIEEIATRVKKDAILSGLDDNEIRLAEGGRGALAYAEVVKVYLAFTVDKVTDYWSSLCSWHNSGEKMRNTFGRQAIPMVWDYAEANPFSSSSGNWMAMINWVWKVIANLPISNLVNIQQSNATNANFKGKIVSTDPPYYDNIGYADLSDFFYVWMRHLLKPIYPDIFATLLVPKKDEMIVSFYRHKSQNKAEEFFMSGMTQTIHNIAQNSHPDYPTTIYYAFKQAEIKSEGIMSTGWAIFLEAIIKSGYTIVGTWPIRTEMAARLVASGTNALASSIVLVCRKRSDKAPIATRREFISELQDKLPDALKTLQESNIAPVDMAQAAIGPGIGIYSKYSKVVGADGKRVSVGDALAIINEELDRFFEATEGDMDGESRFCVTWFQQYGFDQGQYGEAETLVKARNTSVDGLVNAGVVKSSAGKVRLLRSEEMDENWDPRTDERLTLWECVHHLCRSLSEGGETAAGELVSAMGSGKAEESRDLAYRLYSICDRNGWAQEAQAYNDLVTSWDNIKNAAPGIGSTGPQQTLDI